MWTKWICGGERTADFKGCLVTDSLLACGGSGRVRLQNGSSAFPFCLSCVNAETPPFWVGFLFAAGEPDDYLLSHG